MSSDPIHITIEDRFAFIDRSQALVGVFFLCMAALLAIAAVTWDFDHDEHQFIVPAQQLWQGQLPYVDYPHLHVPVQIALYALFLPLHDNPLLVARLVNAAMAFGLLCLLYGWAKRQLAHAPPATARLLAVCCVALPAFTAIFPYTVGRSWNHANAAIFGVAAFVLIVQGTQRHRATLLLIAGLCAGLSAGTRLTWTPMLLPLTLGVVLLNGHHLTWRGVSRRVLAFTAGVALAWLPIAWLALRVPDAFHFGVIEYHRYSHLYHLDHGNWTGLSAKVRAAANLPLEHPAFTLNLAVVVSLIGLCVRHQRQHRTPGWAVPAFTILVLLFAAAGSYAPSRVNPQYHFGTLVFLPLAMAACLGYLLRHRPQLMSFTTPLATATLVVALFGLSSYVLAIRDLHPARWTPHEMAEVSKQIDQHAPQGRVLTLAPLLATMADRSIYPELSTGPFTWRIAHLVDAEQHARLGIVGPATLSDHLAPQPPAAILTGFEPPWLEKALVDYAKLRAYRPIPLTNALERPYVLWVPPSHEPTSAARREAF